ncbi:MAG: AAA family ATPase, partial [candidate division WOR-3 bacterium]
KTIMEDKEEEFEVSLSEGFEEKFHEFIGKMIHLKELNMKEIRTPKQPVREFSLSEDGSNGINVLYNLFLEKNRIPERIESIISYIFPNTYLRFRLIEDGRILLKVLEKNLGLNPPSISNGFYKILVILTALELKPSILVIDEIENSLYAEALEILIDELKNSESTIILTTHSPVVLDIIEPKDLIIVEKGEEGSIFRRIEKPKELKEKLSEAGITLSEKWLYGKL